MRRGSHAFPPVAPTLICAFLCCALTFMVAGGCAKDYSKVWPRRVNGLRNLQVGMSKQAVLMQLGHPDASKADGPITYLCYQLPMKDMKNGETNTYGVWYFIKHEDNLVTKFGPATAEDNCG